MKMWKIVIFLFVWCQLNFCSGNEFDDEMLKATENMGFHFERAAGLGSSGLDNLADQIRQNVQQQLSHLGNLNNLGNQIRQNVQQQLGKVQNIGAEIQNDVQKRLMPVYAMQIKVHMMNGIGGVTTATYLGNNPRIFIIQNGARSVCHGTLQGKNCIGYLEPFTIKTRDDFCYSTSYSAVNDQVCLSSGNLSVRVANNQMVCSSNDGSKTLMLSRAEYQQLCGYKPATYIYYANMDDPYAIPIPHPNPHVTCLNNEPRICKFEVTQDGNAGNVVSVSNHYEYKSF